MNSARKVPDQSQAESCAKVFLRETHYPMAPASYSASLSPDKTHVIIIADYVKKKKRKKICLTIEGKENLSGNFGQEISHTKHNPLMHCTKS